MKAVYMMGLNTASAATGRRDACATVEVCHYYPPHVHPLGDRSASVEIDEGEPCADRGEHRGVHGDGAH